MTAPLEAVLFDYGHTLIYFDERPHSALLGAYENVNRLLADTLESEVPAAQVMIEKVSQAVDAEIQRDYAAGRPEEVEIAAIYDTALRGLGLTLEPALIERVMELEQEGWLNSVHVGPDVIATLEALRGRRLRLGLVSNAAYLPRLMKQQLTALGLAGYFVATLAYSFSSASYFASPFLMLFLMGYAYMGTMSLFQTPIRRLWNALPGMLRERHASGVEAPVELG